MSNQTLYSNTKDMWNAENKNFFKYGKNILFFWVALILGTVFALSARIVNIYQMYSENSNISDDVKRLQTQSNISLIFSILVVAWILYSLIAFVRSINYVKKEENFSLLKASNVFKFISFLSLFHAIMGLTSPLFTNQGHLLFDHSTGLVFPLWTFIFINILLFVISYLGQLKYMNKLWNLKIGFIQIQMQKQMSEFMEKNKSSFGQFNAPFGPFGPSQASGHSTEQNNEANSENKATNQMTEQEKKKAAAEAKLNGLTLSELRNMAKKLNIFGYEDMKRPELIKFILQNTGF
ncbi:Rho termination factor N-terminal domain-containing protein [Mycoplasma iguanae]|uniref:Rho termination factor N-terminal domain-containing protein n=1 Tax=Mycoplasma iguanae TaxID=292461 RepID=A0ABY5R8M3_9MOLU|nr:Rho termination factor N-terminal domain-containing protein [Mycoplasma iguanae]UVD81861.1 Rho termination factor N-terminal domain-containing protein [Mycoplasma iguanae]